MAYKFYDGDYNPKKVEVLERFLNEKLNNNEIQKAHECYVEFDFDKNQLKIGIKWVDDTLWESEEYLRDVDGEMYTTWSHPDYPEEIFTDKQAREMEENNQWDTDFQPPIPLSPEELKMVQETFPDWGVGYFCWEE